MKYHVVIYPDDYGDGLGGILCASLEYSGYASWLGLALSDATRDPRFGRKEAIIGIPGIQQTMAVVSSDVGSASLGQQVGGGIEDGPPFQNPAKYTMRSAEDTGIFKIYRYLNYSYVLSTLQI